MFEKKILRELESLPVVETKSQLEYRDAFNTINENYNNKNDSKLKKT